MPGEREGMNTSHMTQSFHMTHRAVVPLIVVYPEVLAGARAAAVAEDRVAAEAADVEAEVEVVRVAGVQVRLFRLALVSPLAAAVQAAHSDVDLEA